MRLVDAEFHAVNSPTRRFLHRYVEFPCFKSLGLSGQNQDILEVGCGSGFGAVLLSTLQPRSYVGIDLMPEMIELAKKRPGLANAEFLVMDAAEMSRVPQSEQGCRRHLRHLAPHPRVAKGRSGMSPGSEVGRQDVPRRTQCDRRQAMGCHFPLGSSEGCPVQQAGTGGSSAKSGLRSEGGCQCCRSGCTAWKAVG